MQPVSSEQPPEEGAVQKDLALLIETSCARIIQYTGPLTSCYNSPLPQVLCFYLSLSHISSLSQTVER